MHSKLYQTRVLYNICHIFFISFQSIYRDPTTIFIKINHTTYIRQFFFNSSICWEIKNGIICPSNFITQIPRLIFDCTLQYISTLYILKSILKIDTINNLIQFIIINNFFKFSMYTF